MFENPEIPVAELPGTADVDWQSLDPAYKRLRRLQGAIVAAVIVVPVIVITWQTGLAMGVKGLSWIFWLVASSLLLLWPGIAVPKRGYVLRDKDLLFRKGVIWRSVTAVPFNRIQHVETSSTPFDRRFGLATLQLFTAGGSGGDLKIEGLPQKRAEELRIFILQKAGASVEHA